MNPKLTNERLERRAIVYLRQSSPGQVFHNQESQRRQYAWPTKHANSVFGTSW
jgi:DNA invertase Pin-like site-specific DNA recombinase